MAKFQQLNEAMCDLIESFGLVGFETLCIQDKESVTKVVRAIDKAGGYVFGGLEEANESILMTAMRSGSEWESTVHDVQERYMDDWDDSNADLEKFAREYKEVKEDTDVSMAEGDNGASVEVIGGVDTKGDGKKRVAFMDE